MAGGQGDTDDVTAAFHDVPTLLSALGGGLTVRDVKCCWVLGSTGIAGSSTSASDLDVVLVVADGAPAPNGK